MSAVDLSGVETRERLTSDDVSWWNVPEQAWCVCGHQKATHSRLPVGTTRVVCDGCNCSGFHARDWRMGWSSFADRLAVDTTQRLALGRALKWSGLSSEPVQRDEWLVRASRAWRAWLAAGRPIRAFGKEVSHRPVSIPALEDA